MLERNHVVLSTPTITSLLLSSRPDVASVELAQDANQVVAVRVTPLPNFDNEQDFLVHLEQGPDGLVRAQLLRGERPHWINDRENLLKNALRSGATVLADAQGPRNRARIDFNFPGPEDVLLEAIRVENLSTWDREIERLAAAVHRALRTASGTETIRIGLHEYGGHAIELVRAHLETKWRVRVDPGHEGWPFMVIAPK